MYLVMNTECIIQSLRQGEECKNMNTQSQCQCICCDAVDRGRRYGVIPPERKKAWLLGILFTPQFAFLFHRHILILTFIDWQLKWL